MIVEKENYEYLDFKLGQKVMFEKKEHIIIGFDETTDDCYIAIDNIGTECGGTKEFITSVLEKKENNECFWVSPEQIELIEPIETEEKNLIEIIKTVDFNIDMFEIKFNKCKQELDTLKKCIEGNKIYKNNLEKELEQMKNNVNKLEKRKKEIYEIIFKRESKIQKELAEIKNLRKNYYKISYDIDLIEGPKNKNCSNGCMFLHIEGFSEYCKDESISEMDDLEIEVKGRIEYLGNSYDRTIKYPKTCPYFLEKK